MTHRLPTPRQPSATGPVAHPGGPSQRAARPQAALAAALLGFFVITLDALSAFINPLTARVAERFGPRMPILSGLALMAAGLIILAAVPAKTPTWALALAMLPVGLGGPLTMPPTTAVLVNSVPAHRAGTASGVFNTCRQLGGALVVAAFGALIADQAHMLTGVAGRSAPGGGRRRLSSRRCLLPAPGRRPPGRPRTTSHPRPGRGARIPAPPPDHAVHRGGDRLMTTWNSQTLQRIADAEELHIAPRRSDGSLRIPTTIWVVRDGDDLYVRSWRGKDGAWWKTARSSGNGHIEAGGVQADVTLTPISDPALNDRVDAAYRAKYGRYNSYVEPMVAEQARATTLRLTPQP